MTLIPLKCTICGAPVSWETLKCEYCGASFILKGESTILPERLITCPHCNQELPEGSIVCLQCRKILTENEKKVKKLMYLQEKIRDSQSELRKSISSEIQINDNEYIFAVKRFENWLWVVTDSRLLASYGKGAIIEIKYEDIVELHLFTQPKSVFLLINTISSGIIAETFSGNVPWVNIEVLPEWVDLVTENIIKDLWFSASKALQLAENKIKDPEMIFYQLKLLT